MKELGQGIFTLVASLIVFTIVAAVGFVYSLFYSIWLTISLKEFKAFFVFWWRLIDGTLASIGYIFYQIAIGWDYLGNVLGGEMLEDGITHHEKTRFTDKNTTVSASIGELEKRGENALNGRGKGLSKALNVFFNQRSHALDSWEFKLLEEKLRNSYFKPRKK